MNKLGKGTFAEAAVLSLSDFERIKKNATILTKDEEKNNLKIQAEQKELREAAAKVQIISK
jgi:hypothetical protein